jgi:hypothetical protein
LLAPLKVEEFSFDPEIVIFHDIVFEKDINALFDEVTGKVSIAI